MRRDWLAFRDPVRSRLLATVHLALLGPWVAAWAIAIFGRGNVLDRPWVALWLAEVAALWLLMWWRIDHASREIDRTAPRLEDLVTAGVRGGIATAVLLLWANVIALLVFGTVAVFVGPRPDEYVLVGGQWAYLWVSALLGTAGALLAGLVGAGVGGVIGVIDHVGLTVAHWTFRPPRNR